MIDPFFVEKGVLDQNWPEFQPRETQLKLARLVEQALETGNSHILEAPTGTGKTLAYLLPALKSDQRVIISVGNLTLQDHLWWGEYQKLRAVVTPLRSLQVLKGSENYLCLHQLHGALSRGQPLLLDNMDMIQQWQTQTQSGELQTLPLDPQVRKQLMPFMSVGADQCLGSRCDQFEACHFQRARKRASKAEVLLINHTLLLSDSTFFEKGMGALLPEAQAVVVDEAHQLPELLLRSNMEMMDDYGVRQWLKQFSMQIGEHRLLFPDLSRYLQQLSQIWQQIQDQIGQQAQLNSTVSVRGQSLLPLVRVMERVGEHLESLLVTAPNLDALTTAFTGWLQMLQRAQAQDAVLFCQMSNNGLRIFSSRLQNPFTNIPHQKFAWVFISATLKVEGSFDYFKGALGLPEYMASHTCESALDYANQALLWLPKGLPLPADEDFYPSWVNKVLALESSLRGGILMLFSSYQALQSCAELLEGKTGRTVLIYSNRSHRQKLLQQFRQDEQSILLATGSLWEGIDIKGSALSCVAMDKLPFIPPNDVLSLVWQQRALENQQNLFQDYMVPHAITRLRQGIGRLLRSNDDRGLVMLGDRRILEKNYGERFLASIPPMPLLREYHQVAEYLSRWQLLNDVVVDE